MPRHLIIMLCFLAGELIVAADELGVSLFSGPFSILCFLFVFIVISNFEKKVNVDETHVCVCVYVCV